MIQMRLADYEPDVFAFHRGDDLSQVRRRRRNAGLRFEEQVKLEFELPSEVGPGCAF
jgi:hypothetical protein